MSDFGFAVRNDKQGCRSVSGVGEVGLDEFFSFEILRDPVALPPTTEELAVRAQEQRDQLLAIAANRMGPLQDAVDTDQATAEEAARLVLWKHYRIDLNRIEQQEGFPVNVQWPVSPDELPAPESAETPAA